MLNLVARGASMPPAPANAEVCLGFDLKSRLTLAIQPDSYAPIPFIYYKNIALWPASWGLDWREVKVWLNRGRAHEPYSLILQDHLGNLFTYGQWKTLSEFTGWLARPTHIN